MKKRLPYIIGAIVIAGLLWLVIARGSTQAKRFDSRITMRQEDKIPYGTFIARSFLPGLFPHASISFDEKKPGSWDSILTSSFNQAAILVSRDFNADEEELHNLIQFARSGNQVFIIAIELSVSAMRLFNSNLNGSLEGIDGFSSDSLGLQLETPPFDTGSFTYPGRNYSSSFYSTDPYRSAVLGRNDFGQPNFVRMDVGEGHIFIHLAPLAFSNYFILHKNNVRYYEQVMSVIPKNVDRIVWNEYYLSKPRDVSSSSGSNSHNNEPDWFRVFMQYPSLAWGLLTALITLILYSILESRRKQRVIPAYARPRNESLDFVKTIGRLYYDRRDHHNLARKMSTYFLDHVRVTYKLPTHTLDGSFIESLHFKTGFPVADLKKIIDFIHYLDHTEHINEEELSAFYQQLELFYQNT